MSIVVVVNPDEIEMIEENLEITLDPTMATPSYLTLGLSEHADVDDEPVEILTINIEPLPSNPQPKPQIDEDDDNYLPPLGQFKRKLIKTKLTEVTDVCRRQTPPLPYVYVIPDVRTLVVPPPLSNEPYERKLARFKAMPMYEQKSQAWLDQRNDYLTASTIASALGANGQSARLTLLWEKITRGRVKSFRGCLATHWGNRYEPVAQAIYASRKGVDIQEFGMITNPKYPFLGISPDGMTPEGLLEIKCPFSRVIDGKIKKEYFHQIQEQLLVTECPKCDFLECQLVEIAETLFWTEFDLYYPNQNINREKGVIIYYLDLSLTATPADLHQQYLYSPISLHRDKLGLKSWQNTQIQALINDPQKIYLQSTYWHLSRYCLQSVPRDPQWIVINYPILQEFWAEVEYGRTLSPKELDTYMAQYGSPPSSPHRGLHKKGQKPRCLLD